MKTALFLLSFSFLLLAQPEQPGPCQQGTVSYQIQRGNRQFNTTFYYPALSGGSAAQPDTANGPYPVFVFGHGFFMQVSYYTTMLKHLASHGYIVAAPQFSDTQHGELANDMIAIIQWLHAQNRTSGSIFYHLADTLFTGVSGHSMGGGASLLAVTRSDLIRLAVPLAPAETNPSAIQVMGQAKAPVYIIAGQNDGVTPVSTNQLPMYNNAPPFKALNILKGGNHTKFMDVSTFDWSDLRGYLSRGEQLRLTRRYLTAACNLFLKGDTTMQKWLFGNPALSDTQIVYTDTHAPQKPWRFSQIGPEGSQPADDILFVWNASLPLLPGDSVRYELALSAPGAAQPGFIYHTADTLFTLNDAPSGEWLWRVTAYTSDTTKKESENGMMITVPAVSGVKNENSSSGSDVSVSVYPNPSKGRIYIKGKEGMRVKIYSITGELMAEVAASSVPVMVNKIFAPGVYIFTAPGGIAGKFIIQL